MPFNSLTDFVLQISGLFCSSCSMLILALAGLACTLPWAIMSHAVPVDKCNGNMVCTCHGTCISLENYCQCTLQNACWWLRINFSVALTVNVSPVKPFSVTKCRTFEHRHWAWEAQDPWVCRSVIYVADIIGRKAHNSQVSCLSLQLFDWKWSLNIVLYIVKIGNRPMGTQWEQQSQRRRARHELMYSDFVHLMQTHHTGMFKPGRRFRGPKRGAY